MTTIDMPQRNGAAVRRVLEDQSGIATLFRTAVAGPSGQRRDIIAGRVSYTYDAPAFELKVWSPDGDHVGYASRCSERPGMWAIWEDGDWVDCRFLGWASPLVLGVDILASAEHTATGGHDSQRVGGGKWIPNWGD